MGAKAPLDGKGSPWRQPTNEHAPIIAPPGGETSAWVVLCDIGSGKRGTQGNRPNVAQLRCWQPDRYTSKNGGGYSTLPATPSSAPATNSTAMNEGLPENGDSSFAASGAENPKRG